MLIGELATNLGVTPKTLRLYEQRGLIPAAARSANGYRRYCDAAIRRARLIVGLRAIGLPLAVIATMVERGSTEHGDFRRALAGLLSERIRQLGEEIAVHQGQMDELEARYLALMETPRDAPGDCICRAFNQDCRCATETAGQARISA